MAKQHTDVPMCRQQQWHRLLLPLLLPWLVAALTTRHHRRRRRRYQVRVWGTGKWSAGPTPAL